MRPALPLKERDASGRARASPPKTANRIFRQRMETLAQVPPTAPTDEAAKHSLLVFCVDGERFALPLSIVTEVLSGLPASRRAGSAGECRGRHSSARRDPARFSI